MNDNELEKLLLKYIAYNANSIFERTDVDFFFVEDNRTVYETLSGYFMNFGNVPRVKILHALFDKSREIALATEIVNADTSDMDESELEFLIARLGELKVARDLKPIILDAVDEIGQGHGYEALEIVETGMMDLQRSMRRTNREESEIEGDVKASLFIRSEAVEENYEGVAFNLGFPEFDDYFGGVRQGGLYLFASPTGQGKSITLMNIGANMYLAGHNVVYVLLELDRREWEMRYDSWLTGIEFRKIYTGRLSKRERMLYKVRQVESLLLEEDNEEWYEWFSTEGQDILKKQSVREFVQECMQECAFRKNIYYPLDIPRGCTIEKLEMKMNYIRQKWGCDVLLIDYPGIMSYAKRVDSGWKDLEELFRQLKEMARFYRIPIICLAQLHDIEPDRGARFTSSLMRFSKAILDHTDLTIGWVRTAEDLRKRRIIMKPMKTRNISANFEIEFEADFDHMRINETKFSVS
jgi:replicative DNA helicase